MTDRPILFSSPMIRAHLAGTKSQTRRIIKPQPPRRDHYGKDIMDWGLSGIYHDETNSSPSKWWLDVQTDVDDNSHREIDIGFAVGDRLWVREAWRTHRDHDRIAPQDLLDGSRSVLIAYGADRDTEGWLGRPRSSIHMPRWASRLTDIVTEVRVQRLQDIMEEDAVAEGAMHWAASLDWGAWHPIKAYLELWDSINGPGAWALNPWVVAISFETHHANIDALPAREAIPLPEEERS